MNFLPSFRTPVIDKEVRMKIMIVDDNADACFLLAEQLGQLGLQPCICRNGVEAVERYPLEAPDVVIMDVAMPEMDGLEATQRIVRMDADACVYVVSVYSEDMLRRAARAAGALHYYLKDNLDPLLAQICRRMKTKRV